MDRHLTKGYSQKRELKCQQSLKNVHGDGLAEGSALFSTFVVFLISFVVPNHLVTFLAIVLAASILGLLRFNFHPATIFLGDSGSLFIGFLLSALALVGSEKAPTIVARWNRHVYFIRVGSRW